MKGFAEGYYKNLTNKNIKFFGIIGKFSYYLLLLFSPGRMWFHTVVSLLILLPSPLVLGVIWIFFFNSILCHPHLHPPSILIYTNALRTRS